LNNASFVDKAPPAVVDKERAKADELRLSISPAGGTVRQDLRLVAANVDRAARKLHT